MNPNALTKISYGLYILTSNHHNKNSGCIIDACIQAGTNPDRVLISVMKSNYTREIIKKSGVFCISVLDEYCPFELIKHFGFQSSQNVDKFADFTTYKDVNDVPFILSNVCATISAKVVDRIELKSHTVFIGEVINQRLLSNSKPMTYAYYQENVKPKVNNKEETDKKIIGWRCTFCGYEYKHPELPDDYKCPVCNHPASDFVPIYE